MLELTPSAYESLLQQIAGIGELLSSGAEPARIAAAHDELERAAWRLQVVSVRPLEKKIQAVVTELASRLGKRIELKLEGFDLELEPKLRDAIFNFFLHALRNALDHGIEPQEQRLKLGKPASGVIRVKLALENGEVVLEVEDDGRGIDLELVARRLEQRSGRRIEGVSKLTDPLQLFDQLARAGSSKAGQVDATSGRGVGLSSMRADLEPWHPRATIHTELARSTVVQVRLDVAPLALEVIPVKSSGRAFWLRAQLAEDPALDETGAEILGSAQWMVFQHVDPSWKRIGPPFVRKWLASRSGNALAARFPRALDQAPEAEFAILVESLSWLELASS